jgi:AcrR family transcriptional regulator
MPAGRPRSETARAAVLAATREELAAGGFDRLTIEKVALRAGVAKQTVYRWYASKNELVAEGLLQGIIATPTIVTLDGTEVRADIRAWVDGFVDLTRDPHAVALIRAAGAAAAENREIARGFQESVKTTARRSLAERMTRAEAEGQLRPGTPAETVAEILVGSLIYRLTTHEEITIDFVDDLIRTVFEGITP